MKTLLSIFGITMIMGVMWDAFEVVVLPRRVTRRFRLARMFYRATWKPFSWVARRLHRRKRRDMYLSLYGPLSLLILLALWAGTLLLGFAILHWAFSSKLNVPPADRTFGTYLYMSGVTIFTLGYGDVTPVGPLGRALAVIEAGVGFGLLALVIGYLPVLYQAFSHREANIALLDARAGSPPTAAELLIRHDGDMEELRQLLRDWERWSAELLESHLSYPVLCYFRAQHDNQSWLAALTAVLDTCALVMVGVEGAPVRQANLTFAMARHAVVDLAQIFNTVPLDSKSDRLPSNELNRLRETLTAAGFVLSNSQAADQKLVELRRMYEPYVKALSRYLYMELPAWIKKEKALDNWRTSAWERSRTDTAPVSCSQAQKEEHF